MKACATLTWTTKQGRHWVMPVITAEQAQLALRLRCERRQVATLRDRDWNVIGGVEHLERWIWWFDPEYFRSFTEEAE